MRTIPVRDYYPARNEPAGMPFPVIKKDFSATSSIPATYRSPIHISGYRFHLDRLRVLVLDIGGNYDYVVSSMDSYTDFIYQRKTGRTGRTVRVYSFLGIKFLLLRNPPKLVPSSKLECFELTILNPDETSQILLLDILRPLLGLKVYQRPMAWLNQAEFGLDVFPLRKKELFKIMEALRSKLTLHRAGEGSFGSFKGVTYYLGSDGTVWKGTRGFRIYPKAERSLARIELQANYKLLKRKNITLESLPLTGRSIDILEFLRYRDPVSNDGVKKLADSVERQRGLNHVQPLTKMGKHYRRSRLEEEIARELCSIPVKAEDGTAHMIHDPYAPSCAQLDALRRLERKYRIPEKKRDEVLKHNGFEHRLLDCLKAGFVPHPYEQGHDTIIPLKGK